MGKVILKVLLLLIIVGYAALFLVWNPNYVTVCGLVWPPVPQGERWIEQLPLGSLPLMGAVLGVILMAIAAWGEWARQKATADQARAQVQKAKVKLQELVGKIKEQHSQIQELQRQVGEPEPAAEPEAVGGEGAPSDGEQSSSAPA